MHVRLFFTLCVAFIGWVLGQEALSVPALGSVSYAVNPLSESGLSVSGSIYLADYGLGNTSLVIISVVGGAGNARPAHLHAGDCGSGGGIVVPLEPVDPETGLSVTVTTASFTDLTAGDYYLNIHASPEDLGTVVACGEVGAGVQDIAKVPSASLQETNPGGATAQIPPVSSRTKTGVKAEEFETQIPTASYGLFAVGNSGVSGQVQVSGQVEGGTRVVVSLMGTEAGRRYPTELRSGDCGPDGAVLQRLSDFPLGVMDPGASATKTRLSFEEIASENNFLSIYAPDGSGKVLACGEVGLGANR